MKPPREAAYHTGSAALVATVLHRPTQPRASPLDAGWVRSPAAVSMNLNKATLAILLLLVIGALVYEHNRTREIQTTLDAIAKDRDALNRQVSNLNRLAAEAKARAEATPSAAEAPRLEQAGPKPPAPRAEEPPVPGVTRTAPAGWMKNGSKPGSYAVGVDRNQMFAGLPSAYVKSLESSVDGFGGMMQVSSAEDLVGKRVRLSGWVKTEDANDGGGHLWLRVDGQQSGQVLQFDNMDKHPVKGTTDWQQYSVVLDVPPESAALAYGFFVQGAGQMWVSGAKLEPVGPEVPSTNMVTNRTRSLPKAPVNLSFDPDQPK